MATKGGSRRQAVPEIDTDQLRNIFEQHVKENGVKKPFSLDHIPTLLERKQLSALAWLRTMTF